MTVVIRTYPIQLVVPADIPPGIRELETRIRGLNTNLLEVLDGGVGGSGAFDGLSGGAPTDSFGSSGGISGGVP